MVDEIKTTFSTVLISTRKGPSNKTDPCLTLTLERQTRLVQWLMKFITHLPGNTPLVLDPCGKALRLCPRFGGALD